MSIDEQELQEWVKSLRNVIASSGFGEISDEGIYWIIYEYGKLLKNKPSGLEIESKEPEPYDAGLLNDFGGGNVSWWHDYIRSELERAHDHYTQQFIAPTRITEQDAREIFNSILEDQEPQFDYWIENCGGRELLNKLNEDRQVSDGAPAQKLWDYYQNLLRHYGFDGITDLLVKYRKLAEQVPTVAVPDGWKLVPIEPTSAMVIAGEDAWDAQLYMRLSAKENNEEFATYPSEETHELCSRVAYRAMLSASPTLDRKDEKVEVSVPEIIKAVADFVGSQKGGPFAPEVIKAAIIGQLEYGDEFTKLFLTYHKKGLNDVK